MDNKSATPEGLEPAAPAPAAPAPMPMPAATPGLPGGRSPLGAAPLGGSPSPLSRMGGSGGGGPLMLILVVILGIGALLFAVMAIIFFNKATVASSNLQTKETAAADKAKTDQKKVDDDAFRVAGESPFRSYVAPVDFGSFQINFPKNWSGYVDQEASGTQISLVLNPDFVRRTNSNDELAAARVQLIERDQTQFMNAFTSYIKRGTIKQGDVTISGQHGFDLTGQFSDKKTTREVVVPVRDKVLIFINENSKYAGEFNEILAQSKIIP